MLKNVIVILASAALGAAIVSYGNVSLAGDGKPATAEQKADGGKPAEAPQGMPPAMPVSVSAALSREIVSYTEFSGRLRAVEDVNVKPRVTGQIESVHFKEGDIVEKGSLLFTLDLRPFKAAVEQARGEVAAAEARASLAYKESERAKTLFSGKAYSQRELDEKKKASLEAAAQLRAAKAALELALLNLDYAEVKAPITGRVGRPEITVGNVVDAGGNAPTLTTIQSVDPVYAEFDMNEGAYLKAIKAIRTENKGPEMPVKMALADENEFSREGKIKSFDNQLMADSGTLRVRAEFANPDGLLTPGLFARIRLGEADRKTVVVINDAAVGTDQDRRFVYVTDDKGSVSYRPVKTGALDDQGLRIIESGLNAGETIIVNGLQRVRPGMPVQPVPVDMVTLKNPASPEGAAPEQPQH